MKTKIETAQKERTETITTIGFIVLAAIFCAALAFGTWRVMCAALLFCILAMAACATLAEKIGKIRGIAANDAIEDAKAEQTDAG